MCDERMTLTGEEWVECALRDDLSIEEGAVAAANVARRAVQSDEYRAHPIPDGLFAQLPAAWDDGVRILPQAKDVLYRNYPYVEDMDELVRQAWSAAYDLGAFRTGSHDSIMFPLPLPLCDDQRFPVELAVKVSHPQEGISVGSVPSFYVPFVKYRRERETTLVSVVSASVAATRAAASHVPFEPVASTAETSPSASSPDAGLCNKEEGETARPTSGHFEPCHSHRALLDYAYIPSMDEMARECAELAAAEDWGAGLVPWSVPCMRNYLFVSFARAQEQGRVVVCEDGSFSAFNTGLETPFGTELFLCFEPQSSLYHRAWRLLGAAEPGSGWLGKALVRHFGASLPEVPTYSNMGALSDETPVFVDYRHIIGERLSRLPLVLLYRATGSDAAAFRMVCGAADTPWEDERRRLFGELEGRVASNPGLAASIRRCLSVAIEDSLARTRGNVELMASSYNPAKGESILLPAWLTGGENPDAALVASYVKGAVQVHTVIGLDIARMNARVAMRELPQWLRIAPTVAPPAESVRAA